jgi:uncharacterized membrane protein YdjX (TVP38/TMEM64 family)
MLRWEAASSPCLSHAVRNAAGGSNRFTAFCSEKEREFMDSMLALVSILSIPIGALLMLDALSERRYREAALIIIMTILLGVIHYVCITDLPDPHHYPWYLKAALPVGIFLSTIFAALFFCNSKRNGK